MNATEELTEQTQEATEIDWESLYGIEQGFIPDTEEKADWVLARIAEAEAEAERVKKNAEAIVRAAERKAQFFRSRYGADLEWFARQRLQGQKGRTVALLNGSLKLAKVPARIAIDDDADRLAEWVNTNHPDLLGTLVRETVSVNRTELKKLLAVSGTSVVDTETGEVVEIAWVEPETERFNITAK